MSPIGPKARQPESDFAYADGAENQLSHWTRSAHWPAPPRPTPHHGSLCGTIPTPARSTRGLAPGSRSTAPTATIRSGRPGTRAST